MAITIHCATQEKLSLEAYLDHIKSNVNLEDVDSLAESAPKLRALANDQAFVIERLNAQIARHYDAQSFPSAQAIFLGMGPGFYVRANIWPSPKEIGGSRLYQDQFAYDIAHDHNYNFLTVNYFGPGYETIIYEYDHNKVTGFVGESVDFKYLETVNFSDDMVMMYRASQDMHIQRPPSALSISLNLMVATRDVRCSDQYFFNPDGWTLMEYPRELSGSRRISLVEIAGYAGDQNTRQILTDLSVTHPCRRTRLNAFASLGRLAPEDAATIWESALKDQAPLVSQSARQVLDRLVK